MLQALADIALTWAWVSDDPKGTVELRWIDGATITVEAVGHRLCSSRSEAIDDACAAVDAMERILGDAQIIHAETGAFTAEEPGEDINDDYHGYTVDYSARPYRASLQIVVGIDVQPDGP